MEADKAATFLPSTSSWRACERLIRAFEDAWQDSLRSGAEPTLDEHLIGESPDRLALLVELVHVDLEFRFKSGRDVQTESYLQRFPELTQNAQLVVEMIAAECIWRQRYLGLADLKQVRVRFPTHADAVMSRLRCDTPTVPGTMRAAADTEYKMETPNVPGYEIVGELGRGGMGVVYKARQFGLDRQVALKFLPAAYSRDSDRLARFAHEARTASALNHPHICTIHAMGEHEGRPFIVMELIDGDTLESMVGQRVALVPLIEWIGQAARALAVAHAADVVHRDIKPANLMVRSDGYVKVLDFGLARRLPTLTSTYAAPDTDPGVFLGTAAYASPEQARGEPVSSASDIFSLGIVLYELATGRHPFAGDSALAMLRAIDSSRPTAPARINPDISVALGGLIEGMLSKEPHLRPTAADVVGALAALAGTGPQRDAAGAQRRPIVRREAELKTLGAGLTDAIAGRGSMVCIIGEPGIGKTTLVEDFLEQRAATVACLVARSHCSERLAGAAYLPVIDSLADMLRADRTGAITRLLRAVAPSWYAQVSPSASRSGDSGTIANLPAGSQPALLREFAGFLQEVSRLGPVVLFFDDVHWADVSTVDLLAHVGRHLQSLRVLVIATCRHTELLLGPHPFFRAQLELQARGTCTELSLGFLNRAQIDRFLGLAFENHAFPDDFAGLVFSQTEGSPLFVSELLRDLRERGVIAETEGRWALAPDVSDLRQYLPASVRGMIHSKLERLGKDDHRLLTAASIQGQEFDSALIASVLSVDAVAVEERLQELERVHGLVRLVREHEFPDRTLTLRYTFVHVLYQQALYTDLSATRRAKLSLSLAEALESHQRKGNNAAAAELACLFEVGRDAARAAQYLLVAARNAARVCADREAVDLAQRGLQQLEHVTDSAQRAELELSLQMTLGLQLQVTQGYAAPAAEKAYSRARKLCEEAGRATPFSVLWGLWLFAKVRSQLDRARELADELRAYSQQVSDSALALQAQQAQTVTALCRGEPAAALRNMEHGALLYDPLRHRGHSFKFGQDPDVACRAFGAVALGLMGLPDQALAMSDEAVSRSHELKHASTQALALHFAAMLHQLRRDPARSKICSDLSHAIAAEHGLSFWMAGAAILGGWARAELGDDEGIPRLRDGLAQWQATRSVTYQTYYLGLLAEAFLNRGDFAGGTRTVDEALTLALRTGEGLYLAELHRLRGELLLAGTVAPAELVEQEFRTALDIAERQEAKALQLRAALSLARFRKDAETRTLLERIYATCHEGRQAGRELRDLQEARLFLEEKFER